MTTRTNNQILASLAIWTVDLWLAVTAAAVIAAKLCH